MHKYALTLASILIIGCGSSDKGASAPTTGPRFSNIILTDLEDSKTNKTSFEKEALRIYAYFGLEDVAIGTKIKGVWICEKSDVSDPNFKIDEMGLPVVPPMNAGNFSISRPTAGWPVGDYRVDLYMDGAVKDSVKFTIK